MNIVSSISSIFATVSTALLMMLSSIGAFLWPSPTCSLVVATPTQEVTIVGTSNVVLKEGESLRITWQSEHAELASSVLLPNVALSGTETFVPTATTTYAYTFSRGGARVVCSVTAQVIPTPPPVVAVVVPPVVRPTTPPKPVVVPPVVSPPPVVVPPTTSVPIGPTTLAVALIPLLSGGSVRSGQVVPVMYLQITNVGTASTVLKGFWIEQQGTADSEVVIGLSTVDDRGGSRGQVGGVEGNTPFEGDRAFAPTAEVTFQPGQLRLFTIKAHIARDVTANIGKAVALTARSLETEATVQGSFPIAGTTWIIYP